MLPNLLGYVLYVQQVIKVKVSYFHRNVDTVLIYLSKANEPTGGYTTVCDTWAW